MPNIAIYEGGKAARMNGVSLITTDDGEGGKVTWVPQSDRQTGTLHVSENGTYRAEDEGLHSWSKVTVRLAGAPTGMSVPTLPDPITGAELPTGEIGLEQPVPPAGLEPIGDIEPISTEEAESILGDAGLDPDSPNYDDAMEAIGDALGTDPDKVKVVDPDDASSAKENQPKTKGEGQKITGTNPETGDTETIGINPDGTVDKEEAIAEIRLYTDPSKLMYHNGESIDFTGMEFAAYSASGRILKVFPWPDSKIVTPVTVASDEEVSEIDVEYEGATMTLTSGAAAEIGSTRSGADVFIFYPENTVVKRLSGGKITVIIAAKTEGSGTVRIQTLPWYREKNSSEKIYTGEDTYDTVDVQLTGSYIHAGKTAHYSTWTIGWYPVPKISSNGSLPDELAALGDGMVAWIMLYSGYRRGVQTIPVAYGDWDDYFSIWVS